MKRSEKLFFLVGGLSVGAMVGMLFITFIYSISPDYMLLKKEEYITAINKAVSDSLDARIARAKNEIEQEKKRPGSMTYSESFSDSSLLEESYKRLENMSPNQ